MKSQCMWHWRINFVVVVVRRTSLVPKHAIPPLVYNSDMFLELRFRKTVLVRIRSCFGRNIRNKR